MASTTPTIYLVDDDEKVLTALSRVLSGTGYPVSRHSSAEDFLRCHDPGIPGCVIIDLLLPGMDGFDIQQKLSTESGNRPVIFLTGRGDIPASVRAMKAGAVDFLTKPVMASVLLSAVAQALERDEREREDGERKRRIDQQLARLTPRERQVLDQVVAGRLNKQIAADLGIVEKTIKVHRGRMMGKLGVRTVADLVRLVAGS